MCVGVCRFFCFFLCLHIQAAVAQSLEARAYELEKDTDIFLSSLDQMLDNNNSCTFDQAKDKLSVLVGKETAALKQQLQKKKQFYLEKRQHDRESFANAKFVFNSTSVTPPSDNENEGPVLSHTH